jgi:hypothetical protein
MGKRAALTALAAAAVVGVLGCGSAKKGAETATATVTGEYRTTIFTPVSAQGTYTLNFKKNGTGTTAVNGRLTDHTFTFKGSTLTSPGGGANVCPTVGTYRIHIAGKHLRRTIIHDTCTIGRAQILPGHVWTKVG